MKRLKPSAKAAESALNQPLRAKSMAFAVAVAFSPAALLAQNLPTGLTTVQGSVTVTNPTATSMGLNQTSQNALMNAQTFSIGSGYRVDVHQPNTSSVMVMNVTGTNSSSIFGTLTANGKFFLVNPMGIVFAPGASVDVGSIVASTMPISYADATSGRYVFTNNGNSGSVVNQGRITALNGFVGLFAPKVINEGIIVARMGSVALAAGNQVTLDMIGDGLIKVAVNESALNAAVMNKGTIEADGGNVLLSARSASALLDTVINTDGIIRANTIADRNGTIVLDGGDKGVVSVAGQLEAKGIDAGTTGGTVKVLGQYVGVGLPGTTASIDASGDAGGGTILIGGNFHGAGAEQNARVTYIGTAANIAADAYTSGNGGNVAVWADGTTRFLGNISARGGSQGGDGGFIETSGKSSLILGTGFVDASAPRGQTGSWLLDPADIEVKTAGGVGITTIGDNNTTVTFAESAAGLIIDPLSFNAPNANIILQADNDITITDAINLTNATRSFTAQAGHSVIVNNSITTNNGAITLSAFDPGTTQVAGGNVTFGGSAALASTGGAITITNNGSAVATMALGTTVINAGAGAISLSSKNMSQTGAGALKTSGLLTVTADGSYNLVGTGNTVSSFNGSNLNGGVSSLLNTAPTLTITGMTSPATSGLSVTNTGNITLSGDVTTLANVNLTATGLLDLGSNNVTGPAFGGVNLSGAGVTQTGGTVDSGTAVLSINGNSNPVTLAGTLTNSNATAGAVAVTGATALVVGNINMTGAAGAKTTLTFSGTGSQSGVTTIQGANGALDINGGTLTLTNNNTYGGGTTVSAGTLNLDNAGVAGTGQIVLGANTMTVSSGAVVSNPVTINGGTIAVTVGSGIVQTGGITLLGTSTLSADAGTPLTVSAPITGGAGFGLIKEGAGVVTLSGANTYAGKTTINAGTLSIDSDARLGTAPGAATAGHLVFNGGTLNSTFGGTLVLNANRGIDLQAGGGTISTGAVVDYAGIMTGVGDLTKSGGGLLRLTGSNSYDATTISAGFLQVGNGGTTGTLGTGAVTDDGALTFNRTDIVTVANAISGTGSLTQAGSGTVILTGGNSYGTTTISAGTLQVGNGGAIGTLGGGAVTNNAALVINRGTAITVANAISGTGGLTKQGAGTLTLSGNSSYTGATTINGGVLSVSTLANGGANSNIGASTNAAANLVLDGGTLLYTGSGHSTDRGFTLGLAGSTIDASGTGALNLTGTGSVAMSGSGSRILTLTGTNTGNNTLAAVLPDEGGNATSLIKNVAGTWILSGNNTYTGTTTISGGTLQVGAGGTTGALGTGTVTDNAALIFNRSNPVTVANTISGTGSLEQAGSGTVILTANNSYGATTISAGTLQVGNAGTTGTLGTGAVTDNAALTFNRTNTVTVANVISGTGSLTQAGSGTVVLTANNSYGATTISAGTLQIGSGGATGTMGTGGVTDNGALVFDRNIALTVGNAISGSGTLTQSGSGTLTLSGNNSYGGLTTVSNGTTLEVASNNALGGSGTGTTIASGGTLQINGSGLVIAEPLTISGTGNGGIGAVRNLANTNTLSGQINTSGNATVTNAGGTLNLTGNMIGASTITYDVASGATIDESGIVSGGVGTNVVKDGQGTLIFSGASANTYDGTTTVNDGVLQAAKNGALGVGTGVAGDGTTVASGATLDINNAAIGNERVAIAGTGFPGAGGALTGTSTASLAGPLVLTANATVGGTGSLTVSGATSGGNALSVTGGGNNTFTGTVNVASIDVNKSGGTAAFSNNVTTTGNFTTQNGGFAVSLTGALNSIGGSATFLNDSNVTIGQGGGASAFTGGLSTTGALGVNTLNGTITTSNAAIALGDVSLGSTVILNTNATTAAGSIAVANVTGNTNALTLQTGTGASVNATGAIGGVTTLTLANVGGTATLSGDVDVTTFTVGASNANVAFTGNGSSVTNLVNFQNTGTLALGTSGGTQTYNGGLTLSSGGVKTLNGTLATSGDAISTGNITLGSALVTLDTTAGGNPAGNSLSVGVVTGGGNSLSLNAGTGGTLTTGALNAINALNIAAGTLNFGGGSFGSLDINVANALTVNGNTTTTGTLALTGSGVTVNNQLQAGDNILVSATNTGGTGDVTIAANIVETGGGGQTLTVRANNSIFFTTSADVSAAAPLTVVLNSDRDGSSAGAISLGSGTVINSNGGAISLVGGTTASGAAFGSGSNTEGIRLSNAQLLSGAGAITLSGQGIGTGVANAKGVQLDTGSVVQSSSGNITISGTGGGTGAGGTSAYGVGLDTSTVRTTTTGNIAITGTNTNGGASDGQGVKIIAGAVQTDGAGTIAITGTSAESAASAVFLNGTSIGSGTASGDILLRATGGSTPDITLLGTPIQTTGNVTLNAGAGVSQAGGSIVAAGLRLLGGGTFTLNSATNNVTTLAGAPASGSIVSYTDANAVQIGSITSNDGTGSTTSDGLNVGTGTISLTTTAAASAITQTGLGVITAGTLNLATNNGSAGLSTATNAVTNLGTTTLGTGALTLTDGGGLNVTGVVGATGGVALNTSGPLAINNTLDGGSLVSLTTTGAGPITQGGSSAITATTLTLSTNNSDATLNGSTNVVTNLGTTSLGTGVLNLLDAGGLNVTGVVTAGGVTIDTSGALAVGNVVNSTGAVALTGVGSLAINAAINAAGQAVDLTTTGGAGNTITQSGSGVITADTLNLATAGTNVALSTLTNAVTNLGTTTLGTGALTLTDGGGLNVTGVVGATGGVALNTSGPLAINNTLDGGSLVSLTTTGAGPITQGGSSAITATTLTLSTNNSDATLNGSTNVVTNLGTTSLGTGVLNLLDAGGLNVTGVVTAGGVTIDTSGALAVGNVVNSTGAVALTGVGSLAINAAINAAGQAVDLTTTGGAGNTITQSGSGVITADTLNLATAGTNVALSTLTNAVTNLGTTTLGTGALTLTDGGGLNVTGVVGATGGVALNTSGPLAINNTLDGGSLVSLTTTGAGPITQGGSSAITATTLTLSTNNSDATLNGSTNVVTNLGTTSLGTGVLNLLDAGGLNVTGVVTAAGVTLETSGPLAINNTVNAIGGTVSLTTTGGAGSTITQSAAITADTLTGSSASSVSLINPGNAINNLDAFTSVGGFALVDGSGGLNAIGAVSDTTGLVSLQTTGGDLEVVNSSGSVTGVSATLISTDQSVNIGGTVDAGTGTATLTAGNQITESGGVLIGQNAILTAVNGIGLTNNFQTQVSNLQATNTNSGIVIFNTGDITLADLGAGYAVLNTNGGVRVHSTGAITVGNAVTAGRAVRLFADTDLNINADVTAHTAASANVTELIADADGDGTGSITQASGTTINTNSNDLVMGIECGPGGGCGSGSGGPGQDITLATINAGTAQVRIRTEDGGILDANGSGTLNITADSLVLRTEQGVNLDTAVNTLMVRNALNGGGGNVVVRNTNGGTLALQNTFFGGSQSILNANGDISISNDASINIVGSVDASNQVTLNAGGTVTQGASGDILATSLELQGAASYTLTNLTNSVATIAGNTSGTVNYVNAGTLDVGTVTTTGLTSAANVTLNTQAGDLTVSDVITSAGTVRLQSEAGNVTQSAVITAATLGVNAAMGIDLSGATNVVSGTVAMNAAGGDLLFSNANAYSIGTVAADTIFSAVNGLSAAGNNITLNTVTGTVSQTQAIAAAGLELQGAGSYTLTNATNSVTTISGNTSGTVKYINAGTLDVGTVTTAGFTSAANVGLNAQSGNLTVSDAISTTGTVTLEALAAGGQVTQGAGGTISAATLGVRANAGVGLSAATNSVSSTVAMQTSAGDIAFRNGSGYSIGSVAADAPVFSGATGLNAPGNVTLNTTTGTVTQSQAITAAGLELLGGGAYTLTNPGNNVATLAANTTNAITYTDADNLAIGTVGGTSNLTSTTGGVTLNVGGTLTPGAISSGTGNISITAANLAAGNVGTSATTGTITLNVGAISGGNIGNPSAGFVSVNSSSIASGTTFTGGGNASFTNPSSVSGVQINFPSASSIQIHGNVGPWLLTGSSPMPPTNVYDNSSPADLVIKLNGVDIGFVNTAAINAANTAASNAAQQAAADAGDTFGTDSVAQQIEYGFAGDVGNLPPIDHRLQGVGISVPKCFNESREGESCSEQQR